MREGVEATVILHVFRAASTLSRCLDALLAQDGGIAYEVVVVDNGSDDGSEEIARGMAVSHAGRVRVVSESTPGAYAARNAGIAAARGEFLLFTDADCIPDPGWVYSLSRELRDAAALVVGGEVEPDPGQESLIARYSAREGVLSQSHTLLHHRGPFLQTANLGVRREDALAIEGFDDTLYSGGDADFCWRLRRCRPDGDLRLVGDAVVHHVHRETIPDLYRQYRRYGQSDVLLGRKHGASLGYAVLKGVSDLARLLLSPALVLLMLPLAVARRDRVILLRPMFRAVRILGRRRGQLQVLLFPGRQHRS